MAEEMEAAGEIEAVGDTGEVKSFDGKKQTAEGTKGMPKEVKRSMYFMLASIFLWFTAYNAVTTAFRIEGSMEDGGRKLRLSELYSHWKHLSEDRS